jgi:hypothetical protein
VVVFVHNFGLRQFVVPRRDFVAVFGWVADPKDFETIVPKDCWSRLFVGPVFVGQVASFANTGRIEVQAMTNFGNPHYPDLG